MPFDDHPIIAMHHTIKFLAILLTQQLRAHSATPCPQWGGVTIQQIRIAGQIPVCSGLSRLCIERIILVGHSMGGSVAGVYAGVYPERVAGFF
jgi:pimeloyl-ACP methyl ester carboxylesterase